MSDYGDDIITISDEDGNDYELLVLDEADMNGIHYMALTDNVDIDEQENVEVNILKVIYDEATGEEMLAIVDDQDELEDIYRIFEDRMFSEDEDPEDEDDE